MPTRIINLTEHYDAFVQEQIASVQYKNASEALRAGLRLLESQTTEEREKLRLLQSLVAEGFHALDAGQSTTLSSVAELRQRIAALGAQAVTRQGS